MSQHCETCDWHFKCKKTIQAITHTHTHGVRKSVELLKYQPRSFSLVTHSNTIVIIICNSSEKTKNNDSSRRETVYPTWNHLDSLRRDPNCEKRSSNQRSQPVTKPETEQCRWADDPSATYGIIPHTHFKAALSVANFLWLSATKSRILSSKQTPIRTGE